MSFIINMVLWWQWLLIGLGPSSLKKNKTGHCGSALFSLFSGQQSPYMHPSAELYIPVSDVHPSLAMQITLFSLLRGIKNFEKPKKNKMTEPMSQYPKTSKNQKNQKKNDRTHVPVSKNLEKPKKTKKKTKRQNLCPSIWHGVSTFGFFDVLVFRGKTKKNKKTKKAEPMSQYLAWGQYFCFFWFFEAKPKKTKRQNLCPSIWHGVSTFGFFGVFGFSR